MDAPPGRTLIDALDGQPLGPYRLVEMIGRGGMAVVYKALQPTLRRHVAIKVLPAYLIHQPGFRGRFRQEAETVAQLEHPNILPIFDFGQESDLPYIVMPLVLGGTLREWVAQPVPLERALQVVGRLLDALEYAHTRTPAIVHRDIKPTNVLMSQGEWPLLTDFGIAKIAESSLQLTGPATIVGTPEYMAPEQSQGSGIDQRVDVYGMGVILYELLTGRLPFQGRTALEIMFQHVSAPVPPPSALKPDLGTTWDEIIARSLAKDPDARYPSARAMREAIEAVWQEARHGPSGGTVVGRVSLEELHGSAARALAEGHWSRVITLCSQILASDPVDLDAGRLLTAAQEGLRRERVEQTARERQAAAQAGPPTPPDPWAVIPPGAGRALTPEAHPPPGTPDRNTPADDSPAFGTDARDWAPARFTPPAAASPAPSPTPSAPLDPRAFPPLTPADPFAAVPPLTPAGQSYDVPPLTPPAGTDRGPLGTPAAPYGAPPLTSAAGTDADAPSSAAALGIPPLTPTPSWDAAAASPPPAARPTPARGLGRIYVTNRLEGSLTVIEAARRAVAATVPVGSGPLGVAAAPDGRRIYVANRGSNRLQIVDALSLGMLGQVAISSGPYGVAVTPDGAQVYVTSHFGDCVTVVDPERQWPLASVRVGRRPTGVALHPDGSRAYVACRDSHSVAVVDTERHAPLGTIALPSRSAPESVVVAPDGRRLYVTALDGNALLVLDVLSQTVVARVATGASPYGLAVHPDGRRVYVTTADAVQVIDAAAPKIVATIPVERWPRGIALSTDGRLVYVASRDSGTVQALDADTLQIVATLPAGAGSIGLAAG